MLTYDVFGPIILDYAPRIFFVGIEKRPHLNYACAAVAFLATLVALHFTPVSKSLGHSFELA